MSRAARLYLADGSLWTVIEANANGLIEIPPLGLDVARIELDAAMVPAPASGPQPSKTIATRPLGPDGPRVLLRALDHEPRIHPPPEPKRSKRKPEEAA